MYTLIRENRYPEPHGSKDKPLEILVYENSEEAILEFNYYLKRLQNDEEYKDYRDSGAMIEKEYFFRNANKRWQKMIGKIVYRDPLIIGMLVNNESGDKIFSILIWDEIILTPEEKGEETDEEINENKEEDEKGDKEKKKGKKEEKKEKYEYLKIEHKKVICDKCFKHFEVPDRGKSGYGVHLKSVCLKVRKNERDEKVFDMYGGFIGEILIKEDSNSEFSEGNIYCEYCVDIYDGEKFDVLWTH